MAKEGLNGPLCQCGEAFDIYHGVTLCPHCDQACTVGDCPVCRRYIFYVNARVAVEFTTERKQKP